MRNVGWTVLVMFLFLSACSTPSVMSVPVSTVADSVSQKTVPVGIPHDFIPSPGWCRVWYPDRSPNEQPAPERCLEIPEIPSGTWLVYGGAMIKTYRIEEFDPLSGVLNTVNYFELESGRFLRQEKICP
jgi:hypothetical protein